MRPKARRHQVLLQPVVEHLGQTAALPLLGQGQLRGEGAELARLPLEGPMALDSSAVRSWTRRSSSSLARRRASSARLRS